MYYCRYFLDLLISMVIILWGLLYFVNMYKIVVNLVRNKRFWKLKLIVILKKEFLFFDKLVMLIDYNIGL